MPAIETTVDLRTTMIQAPVDPVAAVIQAPVDAIAFPVGALAVLIQPAVDAITAQIEAEIDPVAALIQPGLRPVAAVRRRRVFRQSRRSHHGQHAGQPESLAIAHLSAPRPRANAALLSPLTQPPGPR